MLIKIQSGIQDLTVLLPNEEQAEELVIKYGHYGLAQSKADGIGNGRDQVYPLNLLIEFERVSEVVPEATLGYFPNVEMVHDMYNKFIA